jgi:hypothetical protein
MRRVSVTSKNSSKAVTSGTNTGKLSTLISLPAFGVVGGGDVGLADALEDEPDVALNCVLPQP